MWDHPRPEKSEPMGIGVGLLLIAIGAILAFAVTAHTSGVDLNTVGWILMGVGLAGILLDMVWWHSWNTWRAGPPAGYPARRWTRRRVVTHEENAGPPSAGPPPP